MEILHEMIVKASVESVYHTLTLQSGLASWFATNTHAEPAVGSTVEFRFDNGLHVMKIEIIELEPNRKVKWNVLQGMPGWDGVLGTITWRLTPTEWGVMINFSHSGWPNTEGAFPSVNFKWARFMMGLKTYVETGAITALS